MSQPPSPTYKEPEAKTDNSLKQHDKDSISYITGRFHEMQAQRATVDINWPTFQKQIDAQYKAYQDGRPSSNVPLARSLRELFVAESLAMPATFRHKAADVKYENASIANEEVWKYNWRTNNYDWSLLQGEYTCSTFGTAVYHTHFQKEIREQFDMRSISGLGEIQWEKKYLVKNQILLDNFDIRNFYPDNRVNDFNDALDCVAIQILSYDEFMLLKNNPIYKNIEFVTPVSYYSEPFPNSSKEEKGREGKYVYMFHYWNLSKDRYYVNANNQQIVREHPIMSTMKGEKAIPFTVRQFSYNDNSIWGTGLTEMCANYNSQINNLSELLLEGILRSNSEIIALGDGVEFKGEKWVYKNKVMKFSGNLAANFKQITGTPPNQAMFNMLDRMYTDIAIYTGIDVRNIIGDAAPTAFQADLQRESSMKRMRTWMQNRNFAFERLADLMHDCQQTFFPIDAPRQIVSSLDNYKPKVPAIEIEGRKYDARSGFVKTNKNKKSTLDITKEILE